MTTRLQDAATDTLEEVDPSVLSRFVDGSIQSLMKRLRAEAPVHFCKDSPYGPYWSITKHRDIIEIESLPKVYSSDSSNGGIAIVDADQAMQGSSMENFISMDPPHHTAKRRAVAPAFTPSEMERLSASIRERSSAMLDGLQRGSEFNWVDRISVPLTRDMLAILFDYPWEERSDLIKWSDAITSLEMIENQPQKRMGMMFEMATRFHQLWDERSKAEPTPDLLSMMVHSDALGQMNAQEFLGNMALLVVAGNDTTRNSMSAIITAFTQYPEEWQKVLDDKSLIPNAASEIIRWQSPVAHMRRTLVEDIDFNGHPFKAGEKIILWYISANRDETVFEDADRFSVERNNARRHIAFGHGIHRCLGARLAELQIQILLSEMRSRQLMPELVGDVVRTENSFINGYTHLPVRLAD